MELGGGADIPFYLEEPSALLLLGGQETFIQLLSTTTYAPRFAAIIGRAKTSTQEYSVPWGCVHHFFLPLYPSCGSFRTFVSNR